MPTSLAKQKPHNLSRTNRTEAFNRSKAQTVGKKTSINAVSAKSLGKNPSEAIPAGKKLPKK